MYTNMFRSSNKKKSRVNKIKGKKERESVGEKKAQMETYKYGKY